MSAWTRCSGRTSPPAVQARWRTWHTRCGSNASSCSWRITGISSGCLPTRYGSRRRCGMPGHCGKKKTGGGQNYRLLPLPGDHGYNENQVKSWIMGIAKHRESYFGRVRRPAYGKRGIRQAHLDRPGAGTDISRAVLPNNGGEQPFLLPPAAKG